MLCRAQVDNGVNDVQRGAAGMQILGQQQYYAESTAGASTLGVGGLIAGIINRTGPGAGYIDTLPTVAQLLAAVPNLQVGDSFQFTIRNTVAFAATIAIGTGWTLGTNTAIAASLVRDYLVTITSTGTPAVHSGTTTSGSAVITALSNFAVANIRPGMLVTGTNIPALATVLSVIPATNTIVISANATGSGTIVALTFSPTATLEGVRSTTL